MYAVFETGGKQYKVNNNQIVRLEKLNIATGEFIEFSKVLIIAYNKEVKIGTPFIEKSLVTAKVIAHGRGEKIKIIKFRRRKHYRKHQGHRQWFTDVKIVNIGAS